MNNFDLWVNRRQNKIDEGMFDWLVGKKQVAPTSAQPSHKVGMMRDDLNRIHSYVQKIMQDLGIETGQTLQYVNQHGIPIMKPGSPPTPETITITDHWWEKNYPQFWESLRRFVASHVLGTEGGEKSYLRISQHDAAMIFKTLDGFKWYNPTNPTDKGSIPENLHINDLNSLQAWFQTKLPTAADATLQHGYGRGNEDFGTKRITTGRGNLLEIPEVKDLVQSSQNILSMHDNKKMSRKLYAALEDLANKLIPFVGGATNLTKPTSRAKPVQTQPQPQPPGPSGTTTTTGTPGPTIP